MYKEDTIVAIATPLGEGGIGIIRLSGIDAVAIAARLFRPKRGDLATAGGYTAHYGHVVDGEDIVDEGIALIMRAPRSYTGEDVAELQMHGGMMVMRRVLGLCLAAGARTAERGEFTERAFLNGRLDLAQAEAVQDIISARSEVGLAVAVGQLGGRLSEWVQRVSAELLTLIASLEAAIDYPEEDLAEMNRAEIASVIADLRAELAEMLAKTKSGKIWREGLRTVISGLPNAGKSSLLNHLLAEERAIVTDVPGTTRDTITEYATVAGIPLHLVDTAGIRDAADRVEQIGIDRARRELDEADLVLAVLDGSVAADRQTDNWLISLRNKPVIVLLNKSDLPSAHVADRVRAVLGDVPMVSFSTLTGEGSDELGEEIFQLVADLGLAVADDTLLTNMRQQQLAETAAASLASAAEALAAGLPEDCVTEDLRYAWDALGAIIGRRADEDIVSEIFRRFCVGK